MMIMMTTAVLSYFNSSIVVVASLDASSVTTTTTITSSTINSNTATTTAAARQRLLQEQEDDGSSSSSSRYIYSNLKPCSLSSYELSKLAADVDVEPCIVHEVLPTFLTSVSTSINYNTTSTIPIVQVTPTNCNNHRDGAATAVKLINQDNNGKGVSIGFNGMVDEEESTILDEDSHRQHYVQFHLVSVIAGNPTALSETEYDERHVQILQSLIASLGGVPGGVPYIVGTCSFASEIEKDVANENQAILMAQVGPPGFYTSSSNNNTNSYVFGIHINSDGYPLPNVQSLTFLTDEDGSTSRRSVPVRVIYRKKSEFFYSTCRSAIDTLRGSGFTNIQEFLYDHADDHDDDGVINQVDEEFLIDLADRACRPPTAAATTQAPGTDGRFHPAFFICTLTEQDVLIKRWLETGCRPLSTWATAATWSWADENPQLVPYMEGGGQWHPAFTYNDKYFDSGNDLLEYNEDMFGYAGDYDQVVSYGKDKDLMCSALLFKGIRPEARFLTI
jgi:hypothetical protein